MWLKVSLSLYISLAHHYMYTHTHPSKQLHTLNNAQTLFVASSPSLAHILSLSLSLLLTRSNSSSSSHLLTLTHIYPFSLKLFTLSPLYLKRTVVINVFSTEGIRTGYLQDSRKLKTSCEIRFPEQVNRYRINRIFITGNSLPTFTSFKTSKDIFWGGIRTTDVKGRKHPNVPPNLLRLNKESLIIVEFALTTLTRW